jgi:hypothetical protein
VNLPTTIRRLVALIVIAGLVLAPVLLSVGATAMQMPKAMAGAHAGMMMSHEMAMSDDMAMSHDMTMSDMTMSGMAMPDAMTMPAGMECCPKKTSQMPDCGGDCPFMALCMGIGLQSDRVASLYAPLALVSTLVPGNQRDLDGLAQAPPIRPPKI